jgi:hypothetical protein
MPTDPENPPSGLRSRRAFYRGSGTLAMCGPGPHPGGPLFRSLCKLADRFLAQPDDPEAAKIGSILSLLAFYATKPNDRDFRYSLGSLLMDLALDDEAQDQAGAGAEGPGHALEARSAASPVPYSRRLSAS